MAIGSVMRDKKTRRSFIVAAVSLLAAPAIIRVSSLMPVKVWADTEQFTVSEICLIQGKSMAELERIIMPPFVILPDSSLAPLITYVDSLHHA